MARRRRTQAVLHRDIKSPNILLSREGTAKIGDVGLAVVRQQISGQPAAPTHFSPHWAAPEVRWCCSYCLS